MSTYARLVAKYRALGERLVAQMPEPVLRALAEATEPAAWAAIAAVAATARDPEWCAEHGGELVTIYGTRAAAHAREVWARTLAAIVLAEARCCPHVDVLPQGEVHSVVLLGYRRVVCQDCLRALDAAGVEPDPADADRCDWCGARGVRRFHPVVLSLGPSVVVGDACPACDRALVPGGQAQPAGRG